MRTQLTSVRAYCIRPLLAAALGLALAFTFSCSSDSDDDRPSSNSGGGVSSSSSVPRQSSSSNLQSNVVFGPSVTHGGETYETVVIGTQTWFKRNLNYATGSSKCNDCAKYGRLYDWATAKTACPSGWHLSSNADWDKLMRYVDSGNGDDSDGSYKSYTAGKYLKASSGWKYHEDGGVAFEGNGIDTYGFSALPGGFGGSDGFFSSTGYSGDWWSASEDDATNAYRLSMNAEGEGTYWGINRKDEYLYSVRCVKDVIGSCTLASNICAENISQDRCLRNDGTFNNAACGTSYTYCISSENYPDFCSSMPSKANCPADEDGIKTFGNEALCGGSKGSCIIQLFESDAQYKFCQDVNRGICEQLYAPAYAGANFQTGECGTTAEQYPCCYIYNDNGVEPPKIKWFIPGFSKSDCYSEDGVPANANYCLFVDDQ